MTIMKKVISSYQKNFCKLIGAWLAIGAFTTSCTNNNVISDEDKPTQQIYTLSVDADKDNATRSLSITGAGKLGVEWRTSEHVYVKKGDTWATGSLQPQTNGSTTNLAGTLSDVTIAANDVLTLQFPKSGDISYDGQDGLLSTISANYDYAQASVTVASVDGNDIKTVSPAHFTSQQAIVKFTIKDKSNDAILTPSKLIINDGSHELTVNISLFSTYQANGNGIVYVAIPGFTNQTITLSAVVGNEVFSYTKSGVTFTNGHYYPITVKMTKQVPTTDHIGKIIATNGIIYENVSAARDAGSEAAGMIAYIRAEAAYPHGLAIALNDDTENNGSTSTFTFSNAITKAGAHTPTVVSGTWRLPTQEDWVNMFTGCKVDGDGATTESDRTINGFMSKLSSIEGAGINSSTSYWTNTPIGDYSAYCIIFSSASCSLQPKSRMSELKVRAVLDF